MTPEQKAKEIIQKYVNIICGEIIYYELVRDAAKETAKGCAIEEVKAIINNQMSLSLFYEKMEIVDNVKMLQQLLTEIEKL